MVLVGVTDHREPVLWPLRDEHVQQPPVLCAQPPTSLTYAAKRWYLQPSTEVCTWATRVASPPESQSWKCLGDYILSGQPVPTTGAQVQSPALLLPHSDVQFVFWSSLWDQREAGTLSAIAALTDSFPSLTLLPSFAYHFLLGELP